MDSIDVYLEKKRKRTAYQMNYQNKLKVGIFYGYSFNQKNKS